MIQNVRYLTQDQIRAEAERFLSEHHGAGEIPVPIEEIVEFSLGLDIIPVRGLRDRFAIDGFLANDLTAIHIDEDLITRFTRRYRFTLAHEVGHLILHADYIRAAYPENVEEWKAAIKGIPAKDYSRLEYQASQFAGCVLVPPEPLAVAWEETLALAESRGVDVVELGEEGVERLADLVAKQFQVSAQVITRCLKRDELVSRNDLEAR